MKDNEDHKLGVKESEKVLGQLENVGQQLALAFDSDGSLLATGGEVEIFDVLSLKFSVDAMKLGE